MNIEKLANSRARVKIEISALELNEAIDKAFEESRKNITVKGFRKGFVPRKMYENLYGVESLYGKALDILAREKVELIYQDEELKYKICGQITPDIEGEIEKDKGFVLILEFDCYPEPSIGQYTGIEVIKNDITATEEEINEAVFKLFKDKIEIVPKENQVIENGDIAIFDFAGTIDGVAFDGGTAENYELKIGSGGFINGFEEQMVGMKAGDIKDVVVRFPEDYHAKDLAGKEAVFNVKIHEIKSEIKPEITDEMVKELAIENVENLEGLKEYKKNEIQTGKDENEKERQFNFLVNKIIANTVIEVPESLIKFQVEQYRKFYTDQAKMYNISFEDFVTYMGIEPSKFDEYFTAAAKKNIIEEYIFVDIAKKEGLTPTDEELKEHLGGKEPKSEKEINRAMSTINLKKVKKFLLENNKVV